MFRFTNLIIFRLTRDCNLKCKYCFMKNIIPKYGGEIIDFELYKRIINVIIKQRLINNKKDEVLKFVFHGGEPLLAGYDKLFDYFEYITTKFIENNLKLELGLQTNGSLINDEIAKILNKFQVAVSFSFDGINSAKSRSDIKLHIFEKKFEILKRNNVTFGILLVVGKHNINDIQKSINYLHDIGITSYKINYVEDVFNPGELSEIELDGRSLFENVYKNEIDKFIESGSLIEFHTREMLYLTLLDMLFLNPPPIKTGCRGKICGSGIHMIAVEPDGSMYYCDRWSDEFDEMYIQKATDYDFLGLYQIKKAIDLALIKHEVARKTGCDRCYADYMCEHGCLSLFYSKYRKFGIETRIVCKLSKAFYSYVISRFDDIIKAFAKSKAIIPFYRDNLKVKPMINNYLDSIGIRINITNEGIRFDM